MKKIPWLLASGSDLAAGHRAVLDPSEARHASGPLRLNSGDRVRLIDGAGVVALGELCLLPRGAAAVDISAVDHHPRPGPGLNLAVAVLAGSAMDLVIQKAVELGVERLLPICCHRSQLGLKRAASRMDHWTRLSRQSLKQCHRAWAMDLRPPITLTDLIDGAVDVPGVVAHPDGAGVQEISAPYGRLLMVGPEGGFDEAEESALEGAGWPKLCLGPYVLRAETAAITGAALLSAGLHSTDV